MGGNVLAFLLFSLRPISKRSRATKFNYCKPPADENTFQSANPKPFPEKDGASKDLPNIFCFISQNDPCTINVFEGTVLLIDATWLWWHLFTRSKKGLSRTFFCVIPGSWRAVDVYQPLQKMKNQCCWCHLVHPYCSGRSFFFVYILKFSVKIQQRKQSSNSVNS